LGYPDQAHELSRAALALAQESVHPHTLAFAQNMAALLHQLCRAGPATYEHGQAAIALATEQGFPQWLAVGTILQGWALAERGEYTEAIIQMRQGMTAWGATGAEVLQPYFQAQLAEVYGHVGPVEDGLHLLAHALTTVSNTGEDWYKAELYRLTGELLLVRSAVQQREAEAC
jgi:predicted ATPase